MSKAKPADQFAAVACWLHPRDEALIRAAIERGEGTLSGIVRECVALCMAFSLRPWRAAQREHHLEAGLRCLDEVRAMLRSGENPADILDALTMAEHELQAARAEGASPPRPAPGEIHPPRGLTGTASGCDSTF